MGKIIQPIIMNQKEFQFCVEKYLDGDASFLSVAIKNCDELNKEQVGFILQVLGLQGMRNKFYQFQSLETLTDGLEKYKDVFDLYEFNNGINPHIFSEKVHFFKLLVKQIQRLLEVNDTQIDIIQKKIFGDFDNIGQLVDKIMLNTSMLVIDKDFEVRFLLNVRDNMNYFFDLVPDLKIKLINYFGLFDETDDLFLDILQRRVENLDNPRMKQREGKIHEILIELIKKREEHLERVKLNDKIKSMDNNLGVKNSLEFRD